MKKTQTKSETTKAEEVKEPEAKIEAAPNLPPARQVELGDYDIEILNAGQYSEKAWEAIGRRHKSDPTTRQPIEGTNGRAFLMVPKQWPPLPPPQGVPVTTKTINNILNEFGVGSPIQAEGNMAAVRANLLNRDLTKPISEETHEEDV